MDLKPFPAAVGRLTLASAPEGVDAFAVVRLARERGRVLHVARDDARMATLPRSIGFVDPALPVVLFPAWDCLPYDRVSPNGAIVSRRVETLAALADLPDAAAPGVVLATVNASLHRIGRKRVVSGTDASVRVGPGGGRVITKKKN